jgi:hypothetical protein
MAILYKLQCRIMMRINLGLFRRADKNDGGGEYLAKATEWSVSEAKNEAERTENRLSVGGAVSGCLRSGNGAVSGGPI